MEQLNQTIEATWGIAVKIWWWIAWRSFLVAMIGGFLLGFIIGVVLGIAGVDLVNIQIISGLLGGVFGFMVTVFFFKKIIGKKFKNFTIVLLKTE
ncbi:hypothetical protein KAX97_13040 [candidate division WOR-3 bacterium]|nr:hypothetical protein [candidate division WOR-3 bacterium]